MLTPAQLRVDFPEFASTNAYPDPLVQFWIGVGCKLLRPCAWQDMLSVGLELFTAHQLALEAQAQKTAAAGGVPGVNSGPLSAKAVDKVSASYDTSAGLELDAGHWNLTTYGTRFIRLARMMGSGGVQVSGGMPFIGFMPWSPQS